MYDTQQVNTPQSQTRNKKKVKVNKKTNHNLKPHLRTDNKCLIKIKIHYNV